MGNQWSDFLNSRRLETYISEWKPKSGWNPLVDDSGWRHITRFDALPISNQSIEGLVEFGIEMTDLQRVWLPHALCGRDIFCLSKTHHPSFGKTLAFLLVVLEKLYRERWGEDDDKNGLGSIIICPTREIVHQTLQLLNAVGRHHNFSAGFLDDGVNAEKEQDINILVSTPGPLLRHMLDTPSFDSSKLEILVLDEADHLLSKGFAKKLDAIISLLPKERQTFLFSTTQTILVQDLARICLKQSAEYLNVHAEFATDFPFPTPPPTPAPTDLTQYAIVVSLDRKLDLLWHLLMNHSFNKVLVLLSTSEQVQFLFAAFKRLQPGIPLKCLHKGIHQERRTIIYSEFCSSRYPLVLLSTDEVSRGLDFDETLNWIIQVDCPEDVNSYIHRVGRPARCDRFAKSVLFLLPSEMKMVEKLQTETVPIKVCEVYHGKVEPIAESLAFLLMEDSTVRVRAEQAFAAYLRFVHKKKDGEVFNVKQLPFKKFSQSMGLVHNPVVSFRGKKIQIEKISVEESADLFELIERIYVDTYENQRDEEDTLPATQTQTRVLKEKRNGTRVKQSRKPARNRRLREI